MKMKWFVANVTAVRSPDRSERAILKVILAGHFFLPIQAVFVVEEAFCDLRIPS